MIELTSTYSHCPVQPVRTYTIGTAPNLDLLSIAPLFFGTESTWSNDNSLQRRLTSAWQRSGAWRTKRLISACSVQSLPLASAVSKACAGSVFDWATGSP